MTTRICLSLIVVALLTAGCASGYRAHPLGTGPTAGPSLAPPSPAGSPQDDWQGRHADAWRSRHFTLLGGMRSLDEDEWAPLDDQPTFGIEVDEYNRGDGEGYEFGLLFAGEDDDVLDPYFGLGTFDVESDTLEFYAGWRKTFRALEEGYHPYIAAGLAVLFTELEISGAGLSEDDDDIVPGLYVRLGILWDLDERWRLGLDYRHLFADDADLFGEDLDVDHDQLLLTLGWAF
jgi:hypothetical protein